MPTPFATDFFLMDGSEIADSRKVSKTLRRSVDKLGVQALAEDTENSEDTLMLYEQATAIIKKLNVSIDSANTFSSRNTQERLIDAQQQTVKMTQLLNSMDSSQLDAGKVSSLKKRIKKFLEIIDDLKIQISLAYHSQQQQGPEEILILQEAIVDEAESLKSAADKFFSAEPLEGGGMCGLDPCGCHTTVGGSGYSPMPFKRFL